MTDLVNVLEINDCSVRLSCQGQEQASPGFALFEDNWVATGEEAQTRFRLRPLNGNNTFWQQLTLDPLSNSSNLIQHSADVIYHHIKQLFEAASAATEQDIATQPLVIAYPSFYSDDQLALLLGICQSLNVTVVGLINSALLHAAGHGDGHLLVVDQYLHHTLVNEVQVKDHQVQMVNSHLLSNTGWVSLNDALARAISDEFIRQTRFNPRHDAQHEQELYNLLPQWLEQTQAGESLLQVADKSITLGFNLLADAGKHILQPVFDLLAEQQSGNQVKIILCPQASWFQVWQKDLAATANPSQHLVQQCQLLQASIVDSSAQEGVVVTEQLWLGGDQSQEPSQAQSNERSGQQQPAPIIPTRKIKAAPTHVLSGAHAHPLQGELWLSAEANNVSDQPMENSLGKIQHNHSGEVIFTPAADCLLNNQKLHSATLLDAQDTLSNQSVSYQLIQVMAHG